MLCYVMDTAFISEDDEVFSLPTVTVEDIKEYLLI